MCLVVVETWGKIKPFVFFYQLKKCFRHLDYEIKTHSELKCTQCIDLRMLFANLGKPIYLIILCIWGWQQWCINVSCWVFQSSRGAASFCRQTPLFWLLQNWDISSYFTLISQLSDRKHNRRREYFVWITCTTNRLPGKKYLQNGKNNSHRNGHTDLICSSLLLCHSVG